MEATVSVTLCVLLWAHPGKSQALIDYEDRALEILADHGGQVLQRARTRGGSDDEPVEIQLLAFSSESAFETFMNDPRRHSMARDRDTAIARTDLYRVELDR
jgi:uncharacterized protein (DUF1330 family)